MYERYRGSKRLVGALQSIQNDPERIKSLANLLYYNAGQLREDIQAIGDRMAELEEIEKENSEGY